MSLLHVIVLAVVQGLAELLPVSSSAHVIVAEKLMGMDPSSPEMTLLLVMLHTGTMFAVIFYFWKQWRTTFSQTAGVIRAYILSLVVATALTGAVGEIMIKVVENLWFHGEPNAEIEQLFSHLELIAPALALGGIFIIVAGIFGKQLSPPVQRPDVQLKYAILIGSVQGLCLPFRGLSRSGATISTGMLAGLPKMRAEEFSFALAVLLTPVVDVHEVMRLIRADHITGGVNLGSAMMPGVLGAFFSFLAGVLALKWLSRWLESGRWYLFGVYCLVAAGAVAILHVVGF